LDSITSQIHWSFLQDSNSQRGKFHEFDSFESSENKSRSCIFVFIDLCQGSYGVGFSRINSREEILKKGKIKVYTTMDMRNKETKGGGSAE
jgi:hypothetical protein